MSVMRDGASANEIERIIEQRRKGQATRTFHGVASLVCQDIRALACKEAEDQREAGERWFSVLDTDLPDLPHHADIFLTVPAPHPQFSVKQRWRKERDRLMGLMLNRFSSPQQFRDGAFAHHSSIRVGPVIGGTR